LHPEHSTGRDFHHLKLASVPEGILRAKERVVDEETEPNESNDHRKEQQDHKAALLSSLNGRGA
jgi:hypothetical protein